LSLIVFNEELVIINSKAQMSTVAELEWHWDFVCGSLSGVANCLSGYLFDTLKVKVQMNPDMTMMKYLKQMGREGKMM
jgi:hypothetical protein